MYSIEYLCTKVDTVVTTINLVTVKLSYLLPQDTVNLSLSIHRPLDKVTVFPHLPTSYPTPLALLQVLALNPVVTRTAPSRPNQ